MKRDYKNALTVSSNNQVLTSDAPFFMELIRIMKTKFVEPALAEIKIDEKSYLSEYYGFFFHSEVEESEAELYSEAHEAKKVRVSKIRTFGKKNFFNEKFRHFFWFNVMFIPFRFRKTPSISLTACTRSCWTGWRATARTSTAPPTSSTWTSGGWTSSSTATEATP